GPAAYQYPFAGECSNGGELVNGIDSQSTTGEEVRRLLDHCNRRNTVGRRNWAILQYVPGALGCHRWDPLPYRWVGDPGLVPTPRPDSRLLDPGYRMQLASRRCASRWLAAHCSETARNQNSCFLPFSILDRLLWLQSWHGFKELGSTRMPSMGPARRSIGGDAAFRSSSGLTLRGKLLPYPHNMKHFFI